MLTVSAGCPQLSSVRGLDSQSGMQSSASLSILDVVTTFDPAIRKTVAYFPQVRAMNLKMSFLSFLHSLMSLKKKRGKTGQEEPGFSYI